jgi:hypothetical protein
MAAPMTSKFWLLDPPGNQGLLKRAAMPEFERTPCPVPPRHSARLKRIGDLHVVADPLAEKDFTWTWRNDLLVSPKVLTAFKKHRVTGFEVRPIVAAYPEPIKARPPELYEIIITGWAGLPSREAGLRVTQSCPGCSRKQYAVAEPSRLIDPNTWDGSDLFIVWPLPRHPFASDRLANIIRQEKFSGVKLVPPTEVELSKDAMLDPGTLFEWMPEARALALGKESGIL